MHPHFTPLSQRGVGGISFVRAKVFPSFRAPIRHPVFSSYAKTLAEVPPKTHNLVFLAEKLKIELPEYHYDFIFMLSGLSIPTRYPDDLQKLLKNYSKGKTGKVLEQAKEVLKTSRVCGFRTCQNNKRMDVPSHAL
jgi:hypothetical protein